MFFLLATELLDFSRGSYLITFIQSILVFFVDHKTIELLSWKLPNNLYAEYFYVLLEFLARQIVDLNFSKKLKHLFSCVKSWSKDR